MSFLLSAVMVVASLVGCASPLGPRAPTASASYSPAPCPEPNVPGLPQANLDSAYTCGYLSVPENRLDPQSRTIRVLVARVKAVSDKPRPDPIVYLAGGPGTAGTLSAPGVVAGGMNADRDVIFVNQRGTLHNDPHLGCPELDEFATRAVGLAFEAPSTADLDAAAVAACRERLDAADVDFAAYSSRENAADIADLRVQLGIDQWNVYGVSYGTDLAMHLLRTHPEGIRSVVLDSVVPPNQNIVERWWEAPASGLAAIFRACAEQSACAAAYPNLPAVFLHTVNELSQSPVEVTTAGPRGEAVRVVIDGFKLVPLVLEWSADPAKVADIPRMIFALANGDASLTAAAIAASIPSQAQRGLVGAGLALGTYCQEMANWTTPERSLSRAQAAMPGLPDSVLRIMPTGSWIFRECDAWGLGRSDTIDRLPTSSGVPALILSGTFDSSTAPRWVRAVTPGLSNSTALRFPGVGHPVVPNSACAQAIMTAFIDDPHRNVDRSCIPTTAVTTFSLPVVKP
ncbi:alpha/beta hydrolase [Mycobacterium spongiae]|uniref:Alpha/beta fold hydrolase n=1 Tax=Mycobacterium spongiae TaxID=886343 RepID=A0A975PVT1_9MYCO|nr:alpha/beta hydrolase [Mycobacterium spongiae]QUR66327.1 alpha/beta fold hydrolase [Mycobacterium spongiae]